MTPWQRLRAFFGTQYVVLVWSTHIGKSRVVRAYKLGGKIWANPYLPDTRCELLPGGHIGEQTGFMQSWIPATKKMFDFFYEGVEVEA